MILHHPKYFDNGLSAFLIAAGTYLLYQHLLLLTGINKQIVPTLLVPYLQYIKPTIFITWLTVVLACIRIFFKRATVKHGDYSKGAVVPALLAGILFCISVTSYNAPNIDLTSYFFINSCGYTLIFWGIFRSPYTRQLIDSIGRIALGLHNLPIIFSLGIAFCFVLLLSNHMSWVLFKHFPWIHDTIAQLVHAKFILAGHWFGASHPLREFFNMTMMINDGKWYSQYPPGHVLMLAVGMAIYHPELVNPFLGACTCIPVYLLAKELYGIYTARIAILLTALCAYIVIISSEYMNNATSLLTGTLFLWAYFCTLNRRAMYHALIAGVALGYCFITRPYSAFALALPAGIYASYLALTMPRLYFVRFVTLAATFSCFVIFQLYYNSITTGNPLVFGYQQCQGGMVICASNHPSNWHNPFTQEAIKRLGHEQLVTNFYLNLQRINYLNRVLFEWPIPSLALVALLFSLRGHRRDERLLLVTILSMFISVQFITNLDIGWGPRLVYEIVGILLVCSAKAITLLPPLLRSVSSTQHRMRYYYGCGMLILSSFYVFSWQYNFKIPKINEFYELNNREGNPSYYYNIVTNVNLPALVFVPKQFYKYVSFTNPPLATNPIVFAIDLNNKNYELIPYFPQRNVYKMVPNISLPLKIEP